MTHHTLTGGGGVQLHLAETGNPQGRPILFIHGFSQCWRSWSRQLNSELATDYRLIAMDMRGHGLSGKPQDAYSDSKLWADDINAAIHTLGLDHPILCGWSYGSLVIFDYIRHYGESEISGIVLVGAISRLGDEAGMAVITPEFLSLIPGFFSSEADESRRSLASLLRLCFVQQPSDEDIGTMLEYNVSVPAYVRQGLFTRSFHNDDVMSRIHTPALIVHGDSDAIVKLSAAERHKAALPHAQVVIIRQAGHAPFFEDAATFNQHLRAFAASCKGAAAA
jgi:pimeloyl-ACP methyl ester carboxylesterase